MDPSPGTRIAETPSQGRGLFATRAFRPGDTIAVFAEPLLMLPDGSKAEAVCSHCFTAPPRSGLSSSSSARPAPLRACTRCRSVFYCGKACQAAGWRADGHKAECAALGRLRPRIVSIGRGVLPTPVRGVMQVALRMGAGDAAAKAAFGPGGLLSGNVDAHRGDGDEWADLGLQARAVVRYAGFVDVDEPSMTPREETLMEEVREVICKINTNAFNWSGDHGSGIAVYGTLSMANHSCVPNACVVHLYRKCVLKAERPIAAGDEIQISYIDNAKPLHARRSDLKSYHFTCRCARCAGNLDVYQVCAAYPNLRLNAFSLQPDLKGLCEAASKAMLPSQEIQRIYDSWHDIPAGKSSSARKQALMQRYRLCKPLVDARLWAVEPLPSTLQAIYDLWSEEAAARAEDTTDGRGLAPVDTVYSLPIMCLLITQCAPVIFPVPFLHGRSGREIGLAHMLVDVGRLLSAGEVQKCPHKRLVDVLTKMDGPSVHEAVFRLAMYWGQYGGADLQRDSIIQNMRGMVDMLNTFPGRERERAVLQAWEDGSTDPLVKDFVETMVLKPINDLAAVAVDLIESKLEGQGGKGAGGAERPSS